MGTDDLALMILCDDMHERQISIVCSRAVAVELDMRVRKMPITERMLPEVLTKIIAEQTDLRYYLLINNVTDGQYDTMVVNADTFEMTPIRVSDGVLLAVIDKAIERAIKDENYEQASMLTEEKKRRKGKMDN